VSFAPIGHTIIKLDTVDSTNNYAATLLNETKVVNGTVVLAKNQTQGKGQMGNVWHVEPNTNLTFSIVLSDVKIPVNKQFLLSVWATASISQFLELHCNIANTIKWPNDILTTNTKKICGILIENSLRGDKISNAIVGVGLNVNQTVFPDGIHATSVANEHHKQVSLEEMFTTLLSCFNSNYVLLQQLDEKKLYALFYSKLLGYNTRLSFEDSNGFFVGTIKGVLPSGKLQIKDEQEDLREYAFKEVKFIL
jgi:BirA family transcriptional regulator, biotin operon repressor / biotin---[acetyl-CoA-carboxylase] ligase